MAQFNLRIDDKIIKDLDEYCKVFGRRKTKTVEDWIKFGILLETHTTLRQEFNKIIKEQNFDFKIKIPDETAILIENYENLRATIIKASINEKTEEFRRNIYRA